jgi:hypothetical protein
MGERLRRPPWEPFWEAASGLRVPVVILHTGTRSVRYETLPKHPSTPLAAAALSSAFMVEQAGWFVMSGAFAVHPDRGALPRLPTIAERAPPTHTK